MGQGGTLPETTFGADGHEALDIIKNDFKLFCMAESACCGGICVLHDYPISSL